jgi:hypothetical protein
MGMRNAWLAAAGWVMAVGAAQPADQIRLDVVYMDVGTAVPFAFPRLSREVESILQREGVSVGWRQSVEGVWADGELGVVLLSRRGPPTLGRNVMGATLRDGRVIRAVWIYLPSVAEVLAVDWRQWPRWSQVERDLFATALGRVVAHEIFHALAPDLAHVPGGLMSEGLDRAALVDPRVELPLDFRRALRLALRRRAARD